MIDQEVMGRGLPGYVGIQASDGHCWCANETGIEKAGGYGTWTICVSVLNFSLNACKPKPLKVIRKASLCFFSQLFQ